MGGKVVEEGREVVEGADGRQEVGGGGSEGRTVIKIHFGI